MLLPTWLSVEDPDEPFARFKPSDDTPEKSGLSAAGRSEEAIDDAAGHTQVGVGDLRSLSAATVAEVEVLDEDPVAGADAGYFHVNVTNRLIAGVGNQKISFSAREDYFGHSCDSSINTFNTDSVVNRRFGSDAGLGCDHHISYKVDRRRKSNWLWL